MPDPNNAKAKTTATPPSNTSWSTGKLLLVAALIALVSVFIFGPVMHNGFVNQDDNVYIYENAQLNKPLPEAITYFFGAHYFSGNYIPATMIAYALAWQHAGPDPQFYHSLSLFFHAVNVLLVFGFIYLLSRKKAGVAAFVALFFGIHPMHLESVAWAAELKDVLYSAFFLAGLIFYCKYLEVLAGTDRKQRLTFAALTCACFILSILSKPAAIVFPVVLLLLDLYTRRKFTKWVWLEKLPLLVVSVIFGMIAIVAQRADGLLRDYYPLHQKLLFASYSFMAYIVKLFVPVQLSNYYPYPSVSSGLPLWYYLAPAGIIALGYLAYKTWPRSRLLAFGLLFYGINIALVLQIISVGAAIMAERYTYIPYIGLLFIIAMLLHRLYYSTNKRVKEYRYAVISAIVLSGICCAYISNARCAVWQNEETLATDLLEKYPHSYIALNNMGFIKLMQGKTEESRTYFVNAVHDKPDYITAYINLMNSYLRVNDHANGLSVIERAAEHVPDNFDVLAAKGYVLACMHRYDEALGFYRRALAVKQGDVNVYVSMAECYYQMHDYDNWMKTLDEGLKYAPENYVLLNNKGFALFTQGKYQEAVGYLKASLEQKPDFQTASINLANCYKAINDAAAGKNQR